MITPAARRQWSTGKPAQHYRDGRRVALAAGSSVGCLPLASRRLRPRRQHHRHQLRDRRRPDQDKPSLSGATDVHGDVAVVGDQRVAVQGVLHQPGDVDRIGVVADLISLWILRTLVNPAIASAGRVALTAVLQYGVDDGANIRAQGSGARGGQDNDRSPPHNVHGRT
jgi:hypothetical protein